MASGLLSSMPISTSSGWISWARMSMPLTSSLALSRISISSAVMYGSHSVPLRIRVWIFCSGRAVSLTAVGKPAPPRPLMPAARIFASSACGARLRKSAQGSSAHHWSRPSASMTMAGASMPEACG
ncbi:hypothetical protein D9M71_281730 [compost metagenome]